MFLFERVKKRIAFLVVALVLLQVPARSQAIIYDILLAGRAVGELTITPSRSGDGSENLRVRGAIDTFLYDVVYVGKTDLKKGYSKRPFQVRK